MLRKYKRPRAENAIEWHSEWAHRFDEKYRSDWRLIERLRLWTRMIEAHCPPNGQVVDLGCGTGVLTFAAADTGADVTGIDANREMIDICARKKLLRSSDRVRFVAGDILEIDGFGLGKVDVALCSSVLEYVRDFRQALRIIAGALKPGGILLLSMPNTSSVARKAERISYAIARIPRYYRHVASRPALGEIFEQLRQSELEPFEVHYYGGTPLLSGLLRPLRLQRYSENLCLVAARRS